MPQTSYSDNTTIYREGQIADCSLEHVDSFSVESGNVNVGLMLDQGTNARECVAMAALPADDADAIKTSFSSVAASTTYDGTDLDGATGQGRIVPARSVTFTADNHADWGVAALGGTWITVIGADAAGNTLSQQMFLPAGGNTTLVTDRAFSRVTSVIVGANDGTGGTGTIGLSDDVIEIGSATHPGVAVYDPMVEYQATTYEYTANDRVNVLRKGRFAAIPEHAVVEGEEVYVRVVASGGDVRGQFTGDSGAASANYAKVLGARWRSAADADALAVCEIDFQ